MRPPCNKSELESAGYIDTNMYLLRTRANGALFPCFHLVNQRCIRERTLLSPNSLSKLQLYIVPFL